LPSLNFQQQNLNIEAYMSNIDVSHSHSLNPEQARILAENLALELANEHSLEHNWEGNTLYFNRTGVSGHIDVTTESIDIHVELGWLLSALKPVIENEIHTVLGKHFA